MIQIKRILPVLSILSVLGASPLFGQTGEPQWIQVQEDSAGIQPNQWYVFKHRFALDSVPDEFPASIAADSKYWLYLNDSLVLREGGLKRGPQPGAGYLDTLNLAPYLKEGQNTIGVLLWYFGKDGFSHSSSGQPGLHLAGPIGSPLYTSGIWKGMKHPAFGQTGPPHPNYRLPESNVLFDARRDLPLWFHSDFDESQWPLAKAMGTMPAAPWGEHQLRPIPYWSDSGLQPYEQPPALPWVSDGQPLRLQLPYNAQVTPYFSIVAPKAGDTIDIRTDNYRGGGPPNVRAVYITKSGEQSFETPAWMNGHEVIYDFPKGVEVRSLQYRETGYPTVLAGAFSCSDSYYDTLWQKAARTLYVTMRDNYMDCPGRERAQWWGDVVLEAGETYYATDRRSDWLTRKAIHELMEWQRADSTLFSPVPAGNWDKELPTQMLASIGYYGIWEYFWNTGDTATLRKAYPGIKRYLALWQTDADGLVIPRKGGWTWGDWGPNKDMPILFNGWYYLALKGAARMAAVLEDSAYAKSLEEQMLRLKSSFNKQFWTPGGYQSPEHEGPPDDRSQGLAVVAGLAPDSCYATIHGVLESQYNASPYMEKYILETLFEMGYPGLALERMKKRFREMVESPLTTLWEGWELNSGTWGGGTYNHAWSGGGLTLLSQKVVGITPVETGWKTVEIRPQLGTLDWASAKVISPLGPLYVSVDRTGAEWKVEVKAPPGMKVIVVK